MAAIRIPFSRTVFLPDGSPPLGSLTDVQVELRDGSCGGADGQIWCRGELDLLVDYRSWPVSGGASYAAAGETGEEWQALLTLPLFLTGPGAAPGDGATPELVELEWYAVGAAALELEGYCVLTPELPDADARPDAEARPAAASPAAPSPEETTDYVRRPAAAAVKPQQENNGGWHMVSLEQERETREQQQPQLQPEPQQPEPQQPEPQQPDPQPEPEPVAAAQAAIRPRISFGQTAARSAAAAPQPAEEAAVTGSSIAAAAIGETVIEAAPAAEEPAAEALPEKATAAETVPGAIADDMAADAPQPVEEAAVAGSSIAAAAIAEALPESAPESAVEPVAAAVLPPPERRRRAVGLPRLLIDAKNNKVEISAFNLQIKL